MSADRGSGRVKMALWATFGAMILICAGLVAWKPASAPAPAEEEKIPAVTVLKLEARDVPDRLALPGRIEAFTEVTLSTEKPGRVASRTVDKGSEVKAGQLLLRLDDRVWAAQLQQAEIESRDALRDEKRWQELRKAGAVADSEYDAVRRRRELADAALAAAAANVEHCRIVSPIEGVVDDRMAEVGEHVNEGAPAFRVVDIGRVKVLVDVPERDVLTVSAGRCLTFTAQAAGGGTCTGEIAFVAAAARRENNSFPLELVAPNPDRRLRPGMVAEVFLDRGLRRGVLAVPLSAVIPAKGEHVLFVVEDGRAVRRVVRLDRMTAEEAIVSSGIKPGDSIVVAGHRSLQDGARVEVAGNAEAGGARPEPAPSGAGL